MARGLQWLRCCGVSHGAICARNVVLVDGSLPKLTGFGLLTYTNDLHVPDYRRWVARELLAHYSASQAGKIFLKNHFFPYSTISQPITMQWKLPWGGGINLLSKIKLLAVLLPVSPEHYSHSFSLFQRASS